VKTDMQRERTVDKMRKFIENFLKKRKIKKIVTWCIKSGISRTTYGTYIIDFEEISEAFDVSVEWIKGNLEDFDDEFNCRKELIEGIWHDYDDKKEAIAFDMNLCGISVCKRCPSYKCHRYCDGCNIPHDESWGANVY